MKGLGQHTEEQREAKTAGEYRQAAEGHTQTLKDFWKNFLVSGLFVVAAVVIILACLAWFFNNSQVTATGVGVSAAGARYSIMADGDKKGVYDQPSGLGSSDSMNVSVTSNLNNYDGTGTLAPGSYGQITFTVTPMTKDLRDIKIQLSRDIKPRNGSSVDSSVGLLASGHILFFEDTDGDFYKDPVLDDELTIARNSFCEKDSSETTKSVTKTLYWVWPEHFRNIVLTGRLNYEKNLFAPTSGDGYTDLLDLINGENSWQRFFVTKPAASASGSMPTSEMQECSDAYDAADEKIGREIQYMQVRLTAEEEPTS